ncbi:hypothetical protein COCSADRAFT_322347 [Bipolaris sorokiniana ND90Pr]|uniref:Uncharacterized protein n=1 Tax=Cochliobolus sativus (strain ND90Pr / ATCC 201652) TaxID=665912 RepID=M2SA64_COCSN|nr:uncharacterized protein COCSADRAFT_322347 [Bipolaris sorokiniana ND90Pr]EMD64198.1 hypothetical protein COCSADRAFT_322347 [Bipolaris sorokiniana ND90Pr]
MTCGMSLVWCFSLLPPPHTSRTPPSLHLPWSRGPVGENPYAHHQPRMRDGDRQAGTHASKGWVCECKWYRRTNVCRYSTRKYLQIHERTHQRMKALLV